MDEKMLVRLPYSLNPDYVREIQDHIVGIILSHHLSCVEQLVMNINDCYTQPS